LKGGMEDDVDPMALIESIEKLTTETQVMAVTQRCIRAIGAEHFVYTSFLGDSDDPEKESRRFLIGCAPAWCQMYNLRKWYEIDPYVTYSRSHNTAPVFGSEIKAETPGQIELLKAASENGFTSTIVVPVHTGNVRHMGMLYAGSSMPQETGEPVLRRNRSLFRLLAGALLDWWIVRVREEAIATYQLEQQEVLVLKLALEGLAAKQKAEELGVPVRTIYTLYQKIKNKFSVEDIREAARIANARGILNYMGRSAAC